jgi:hypothetical protein
MLAKSEDDAETLQTEDVKRGRCGWFITWKMTWRACFDWFLPNLCDHRASLCRRISTTFSKSPLRFLPLVWVLTLVPVAVTIATLAPTHLARGDAQPVGIYVALFHQP